ncbi:hypothetical protein [Pseudomonas syringae]|uniref:hypothetical protein n=1 Tax=Pseudomonas syringae TaxID=317 RepID=UPI0011432073|nr:hypothetical protein [Pseudomonas syringae]
MKKDIIPTKPHFIEERNGVFEPLPTFITRTTLRSILDIKLVNNLLETRSIFLDEPKRLSKTPEETELLSKN